MLWGAINQSIIHGDMVRMDKQKDTLNIGRKRCVVLHHTNTLAELQAKVDAKEVSAIKAADRKQKKADRDAGRIPVKATTKAGIGKSKVPSRTRKKVKNKRSISHRKQYDAVEGMEDTRSGL